VVQDELKPLRDLQLDENAAIAAVSARHERGNSKSFRSSKVQSAHCTQNERP
jgi:hypothetical protein